MLTIDEFPRSLQGAVETSFVKKNSFTRFPSVLVITKLSIIITLRQYGIEVIERLLCYDSLSLTLLWTFVKAYGIVCCYIFNHDNYTMSTSNLIQDLGLLIVSVDARWIETRFVFTAYNMIVSCDFHGSQNMDLVVIMFTSRCKTKRSRYYNEFRFFDIDGWILGLVRHRSQPV